MTFLLPLSKGQFTAVDWETIQSQGGEPWCCTTNGYAARSVKGKTVLLHRRLVGAKGKEVVHHRNHDKLDNRRHNLEKLPCQREHVKRYDRVLGPRDLPKGVYRSPGSATYRAQVTLDKKAIPLGSFRTAAAAEQACKFFRRTLMQLKPNDLHFVFSDTANRIQCWTPDHKLIWQAEMRNSTVNDGSFGHFGNCPRGEFVLGSSVPMHAVPYGFFFTPVLDAPGHHAMADFGRSGIGVHGGGSGLGDPFADEQGWMETHGCLRLQNSANAQFVKFVHDAHAHGGVCYLTVAGQEA